MSDKLDGYINEDFRHLIDRLNISGIEHHIISIKMQLSGKVSKSKLKRSTEKLTYCYKKLKELSK